MNLIPFDYNGQQVRTIVIDGEPWFVAKDVCDVLEHTNSRVALERLDDDEKGVSTVYTPGGPQEMAIVSEAGLYVLVLTSRKPEAKLFKRWVTHEVIPAIRRTGAYGQKPVSQLDALRQTVDILAQQEQRLAAVEATATTLTHRIDSLDAVNVQGDLRQRLEKMIRKYAWSRGVQYDAAWREFDSAYNTGYHTNLTALRDNYCGRHGLRHITRPGYLEATGRLEDAIRVADKMLAGARAVN